MGDGGLCRSMSISPLRLGGPGSATLRLAALTRSTLLCLLDSLSRLSARLNTLHVVCTLAPALAHYYDSWHDPTRIPGPDTHPCTHHHSTDCQYASHTALLPRLAVTGLSRSSTFYFTHSSKAGPHQPDRLVVRLPLPRPDQFDSLHSLHRRPRTGLCRARRRRRSASRG